LNCPQAQAGYKGSRRDVANEGITKAWLATVADPGGAEALPAAEETGATMAMTTGMAVVGGLRADRTFLKSTIW